MSENFGTLVAASILPFDSEDTYATHEDTYGKGGWRSVVDLTERDSIPQERRKIGMAVYVQENDQIYILKGGTGNSNWKILPTSGSSAYTHEQLVPQTTWLIIHDLNKKPSVALVDDNDEVIEGDIQYIDDNRVLATFKVAFKGKAYCN